MATTVVSSPGKVLMAGGYLVLDPAYSGVVVSTSSRFYTVVQTGISGSAPGDAPVQISVRSPQFVDARWVYQLSVGDSAVRIDQPDLSYVFATVSTYNRRLNL